MPKHAPKIFQFFGVLMALNLVFLLTANGETNYQQAATLAAIGAAGTASPTAKAALAMAYSQNLANDQKTQENKAKQEGRAAVQAPPLTQPTPGPKLDLGSVPVSLKDGVDTNSDKSSVSNSAGADGAGGILGLLGQTAAKEKKAKELDAERRQLQFKEQVVKLTADYKKSILDVAETAQKQANELLGTNDPKPEVPAEKPPTLAEKIATTAAARTEESKRLRDSFSAKVEKKSKALSTDGLTWQ